MMSWLGVRRQDWLEWSADAFDRELIAFNQEKTDVPNVLPWSLVPDLVRRVAAAKETDSEPKSGHEFERPSSAQTWSSARRHASSHTEHAAAETVGSAINFNSLEASPSEALRCQGSV